MVSEVKINPLTLAMPTTRGKRGRTTVTGDQPHIEKRLAKGCPTGGDADIAHESQTAAGPDGGAVDGGDGGDFHIIYAQQDFLKIIPILTTSSAGVPANIPFRSFISLTFPPEENAGSTAVRMSTRVSRWELT